MEDPPATVLWSVGWPQTRANNPDGPFELRCETNIPDAYQQIQSENGAARKLNRARGEELLELTEIYAARMLFFKDEGCAAVDCSE
jgi:hypothetical protein